MDYTFNVTTAGPYTFNLISTDTAVYDPYIVILRNGTQVAGDDDGGGNLNARLSSVMLEAGSYTVRVTRFGSGQIAGTVTFSLSAGQY